MKTGDLVCSMWKYADVISLNHDRGYLIPGNGPFICIGDVGNYYKVILLCDGTVAYIIASKLKVIK